MDRDGVVRGWLKNTQRSGVGELDTIMHPDYEGSLEPIVELGLIKLTVTSTGTALCLNIIWLFSTYSRKGDFTRCLTLQP